jgi:hypothetical protein
VTLITSSRHIRHGLSSGLPSWRENGWHWERFGRLSPVKNSDLWQRIDRLTDIHHLECRPGRIDKADDLATPQPAATSTLIRTRSGKRLRIDQPPAGCGKSETRSTKHKTSTKSEIRNAADISRRKHRLGPGSFLLSNLFRASCFVRRASRLALYPWQWLSGAKAATETNTTSTLPA